MSAQALEYQKAQLERLVSEGESLARLVSNKDFITVIEKGFCGSEVVDNLANSFDDRLTAESRENALVMAKGGAALKSWIEIKQKLVDVAKTQLGEIDDEIEAARQEEGE